MRIVEVEIWNFRGIRELKWNPTGKLVCLVGPGDSGKSTILEAIERALHPGEPNFSDSDFTDLDNTKAIEIRVTLTGLPDSLLHDKWLGLHLRGWSDTAGLQDEPIADHPEQSAVTIRLSVDATLEPIWEVFTQRGSQPVGLRTRALFGVARVGHNPIWHLSWSRRSALSRAAQVAGTQAPLSEAVRIARAEFAKNPLTELKQAAKDVDTRAQGLGAKPRTGLQPLISPAALSISQGAVSLHDGQVPVAVAGAGTQRLTAIAVQQWAVASGSILLLDELETGLEPHRLRHLIRELRESPEIGQLILTSHSPVAVAELEARELAVVSWSPARVAVEAADETLQGLIRATSEALLSSSVIVCEGPTEIGLCRAWDRSVWQPKGLPALGLSGCHPVDGGGMPQVSSRAMGLRRLGYRTAIFVDGDREVAERGALITAGVAIFGWNGAKTETVLADELPFEELQAVVDLATSEHGEQAVADSIRARLAHARSAEFDHKAIANWPTNEEEADLVRKAIGAAAAAKEWFKRIDRGEALGNAVSAGLGKIPGSQLSALIAELGAWASGN